MLISLWIMGILFILYFAFSFPFVMMGYYEWKIQKIEEEKGERSMKTFVVYDDRTDEIIFESDDKWEVMMFMAENYDENHPDFRHVWMKEIASL